MDRSLLRQIPKMDQLLARPAVQAASEGLPAACVKDSLRCSLESVRQALLRGEAMMNDAQLETFLCENIRKDAAFGQKRVINGTGIVLHTNLGRAPLGKEAAGHLAEVCAGYSDLEYDLEQGSRGSRTAAVEALLCKCTGAEAALVVNNNAAAVFLMLHTLAYGKEVVISRGELVEIGGSFRVPEIMAESGAVLHEVGTTNKTHLYDYTRVLDENPQSVLLKVHTSNFCITGFTDAVSLQALHELASRRNVPLLYDLGAGWLVEPEKLGLHEGVSVQKSIPFCDVLCFSGDKLLGGSQAGILLGKKEMIAKLKKNQLLRMLRVDKLTLCVLEAVLRAYASPEDAIRRVPTLQMCAAGEETLHAKADALCELLRASGSVWQVSAERCQDEIGGGAMPGTVLPGWCVAVESAVCSSQKLEARLRHAAVPVVGYIRKDRFCLSVRTLLEEDLADIAAAFAEIGETL